MLKHFQRASRERVRYLLQGRQNGECAGPGLLVDLRKRFGNVSLLVESTLFNEGKR